MACAKATRQREWYQSLTLEERRAWIARRDRERVQRQDRERWHRDKPKRRALIYASKARHPERAKARHAVSNAIRDRRLYRGPCAVCGVVIDERGRVTHGHHAFGYDRPLDVIWLCQRHHTEAHQEMK